MRKSTIGDMSERRPPGWIVGLIGLSSLLLGGCALDIGRSSLDSAYIFSFVQTGGQVSVYETLVIDSDLGEITWYPSQDASPRQAHMRTSDIESLTAQLEDADFLSADSVHGDCDDSFDYSGTLELRTTAGDSDEIATVEWDDCAPDAGALKDVSGEMRRLKTEYFPVSTS